VVCAHIRVGNHSQKKEMESKDRTARRTSAG